MSVVQPLFSEYYPGFAGASLFVAGLVRLACTPGLVCCRKSSSDCPGVQMILVRLPPFLYSPLWLISSCWPGVWWRNNGVNWLPPFPPFALAMQRVGMQDSSACAAAQGLTRAGPPSGRDTRGTCAGPRSWASPCCRQRWLLAVRLQTRSFVCLQVW